MLNIKLIKKDFPVFKRRINGYPLVYLDSAATSQKPQEVIDALVDYYQNHNANVHRGIHTLGDESTKMYDSARQTVAEFIGAEGKQELIFVRNTTEAINLVAYAWGENNVGEGDEIILTEAEHHSNIVPWQLLADRKKAKLKFINVDQDGKLDLQDFRRKLSPRTKLVSVVHVSNFLGTINPIKEIAEIIKEQKTENNEQKTKSKKQDSLLLIPYPLLLVDGAQAVPHMPVNVKQLGCDFYAFSGHKMYGPMGIGCLWGKKKLLDEMPPFLTGGGTINTVDFHNTTFTDLPDKFEAGTPNVAGAAGLAAAVKYLKDIGMERIRQHEVELTEYALEKLKTQNSKFKIRIYGPEIPEWRGGLIAFTLEVNGKEVHGHDVAQILDSQGIAVRSGHHCVMPMHEKLGLAATTRVSFGIYNTKEDVDRLVEALKKIEEVFTG
ncbi:cysteine desulfurase [Candidatus Collierbacteria bacterium]|nr:cysteine desulfurase [Candidatus Collierbacteria bacterium]